MSNQHVDRLQPMKPWMITKNVVILSFASMVNFTAFGGAVNLQSSIHSEAGLGTASLAALYTTVIFSNMFLSVGLINNKELILGTKWTISIAYLSYMPYIAAQIYPNFYTMIPAAVLLGLACAPLWSAQFTYISVCAEVYSKVSNIPVEELLTRFFGIFYMIFAMHQVWGNLISSLVLTSDDNAAAVTSVNETLIPIICGAEFLPSADASQTLPEQPPEKIWLLSGIYLAFMAVAAFVTAVGLDSINSNHESGRKLNTLELLVLTLKVMVEPMQLLLITIEIFVGLEIAFIGADFSAAYVSCAVGTGYVGFVFMVFGLSGAIGSLFVKYLAKVVSRVSLICTATLVNATLHCAILMWRLEAQEIYTLYIVAALWGFCQSIWAVQINALCATLCPGREEAAFSNCQIWQSVGFILMYIIPPYMITSYKINLLLASVIIGGLCCFIVEYQQRKQQNKQKRNRFRYTSINFNELSPRDDEL